MNADTAAWLLDKIKDFGSCEIGIRMSDGHIINYFYQIEKHTYHRGLHSICVDKDRGLILAESSYGLTGDDAIADFIDVGNIAMISVIEVGGMDETATL